MMTSGGLEILSCVDVGNVSPLGTGVCLERGDAGCPPTVLQTQSLGWSWMHNPPPNSLHFIHHYFQQTAAMSQSTPNNYLAP